MSAWAVRTRPWVIQHSPESLGGAFLYVAWALSALGTLATALTFAYHAWSFRGAASSAIRKRYLVIAALPLVSAAVWCLVVFDLWTATPWQLALDIYEPIVINQFLKALLDFAGGEGSFVELIAEQPAKRYYAVPDFMFRCWPLCKWRGAETAFDASHVAFARRGVQAFFLVQVVQVSMAVLYTTFQVIPAWVESLWRVAVVSGTSFMFYGLVVLCHACYQVLSPYNIPGKLVTLKGTVGLLLGQQFILTIIAKAGALPTSFWGSVLPAHAKTQQQATLYLLQGFLACVQMPLVAIGGLWWWPAEDCRSGRHLPSQSCDAEICSTEKGEAEAEVPSAPSSLAVATLQTVDVDDTDGVSSVGVVIEMGAVENSSHV